MLLFGARFSCPLKTFRALFIFLVVLGEGQSSGLPVPNNWLPIWSEL